MAVERRTQEGRRPWVLGFRIGGESFCIAAEDIQEIILSEPLLPMPDVHPTLEGVFRRRDTARPVLTLAPYLLTEPMEPQPEDVFLVTKGNPIHAAFRVQKIDGIFLASQAAASPALPEGVRGEHVDQVLLCDGEPVMLPDYKGLIAQIQPLLLPRLKEVNRLRREMLRQTPLLIAQPTPLTAVFLRDALTKAGYANLHFFPDGQSLWQALLELRDTDGEPAGCTALVITDLEMPRMDGLRLIGAIRGEPGIQNLPVLAASVELTEEARTCCKEAGADGAYSKPEFPVMAAQMEVLLERSLEVRTGI